MAISNMQTRKQNPSTSFQITTLDLSTEEVNKASNLKGSTSIIQNNIQKKKKEMMSNFKSTLAKTEILYLLRIAVFTQNNV